MAKYFSLAKKLLDSFKHISIEGIVREQYLMAYFLSNLLTIEQNKLDGSVYLKTLLRPSISGDSEPEVIEITSVDVWMTPLINFVTNGVLLENRAEAKRIYDEHLGGKALTHKILH